MSALLLALVLGWTGRVALAEEPSWHNPSAGNGQVEFYFFWSSQCPHCREALPFIKDLGKRYPWLHLNSHELMGSKESRLLYQRYAEAFDAEARSVPGFFFCRTMLVGFDTPETTGQFIEEQLLACRQRLLRGESLPKVGVAQLMQLPLLGSINVKSVSLPVMTLVIAGLDAFNPCAFFVLLFLLSMLVHARSRKRMLLIGGVFVFFSGFIYFLFMAAWLNAFLLFGQLRWVTAVAGLVAVVMALINIKDYLFFGVGPSLSISAEAKPGLFKRMRGLLQVDNLPAMLLGAAMLAVAANSYELLCTSGLPMVYTRLLTLEHLPTAQYYLYLLAYNLVYVIPLAVIVVLFSLSLGSRKLQAREGRLLKLLSGLMMLGLGLMLLVAPEGLGNIFAALGLMAAAVLITIIVALFDKCRA